MLYRTGPRCSPAVATPWRATTLRRNECIKVPVPEMTESISEGSIQTWNKQPGDIVQADEVIAVIETDKISVDVLSPVTGQLTKTFVAEGDNVLVGDDLFEINTDILTAGAPAGAPTAGPANALKALSFKDEREERRVPMPRIRQKIGERLKAAQSDGVCLTTFQELDMSALMALRKKLQPRINKDHNLKLGFMSFFLAAAARLLEQNPSINNLVDGKTIMERNFVDISVAVSTPNGLVVPVVRDAHKKSIVELERDVASLASRARDNKLGLEEMTGGTFTISNGGVYGSLFGTPVINPPQSAILGMHGIQERAVVRNGQIVARPMMFLALTYDHRIVDGREAVTFLKGLAQYLENPEKILEVTPLE